jgi:enoyl reductase-like protein
MPVTAKLSRTFYERLGDDIANELVDWFNAVDATYRADLRELNELNFQRFDAKVEQRFAEADAKWERRFAEFEVRVERRFGQADAKLETCVADLRSEIRSGLADQRAELLKWMFGFWIATLVPLAGLIVALRLV